jgi:hypothetical protein
MFLCVCPASLFFSFSLLMLLLLSTLCDCLLASLLFLHCFLLVGYADWRIYYDLADSPGPRSMPFRREHLRANLADRPYWAGEKSDGERRFLFAHQGLAFFIDMRGGRAEPLPAHLAAKFFQHDGQLAAGTSSMEGGCTILDGELVEDLSTPEQRKGLVSSGGSDGSGGGAKGRSNRRGGSGRSGGGGGTASTPNRHRRMLYLVFDAAVLGGQDVGRVEDFKYRLDAARSFLASRGALVDGDLGGSGSGGRSGGSGGSGSSNHGGSESSLSIQVKTFVAASTLSALTKMLHPLPTEVAEGNAANGGRSGSTNKQEGTSNNKTESGTAAGYLFIEQGNAEVGHRSFGNGNGGSSGGRRTRSDGLVFVPAQRPYYAHRCLKWKPSSCTTVDFAVTEKSVADALRNGGDGNSGSDSSGGGGGGSGGGGSPWVPQDVPLLVSAGRQRHEVTTLTLSNHQAALNLLRLCQNANASEQRQRSGDRNSNTGGEAILECAFAGASSGTNGGWQVQRPRVDKRKPNSLATAWRNMEVGEQGATSCEEREREIEIRFKRRNEGRLGSPKRFLNVFSVATGSS